MVLVPLAGCGGDSAPPTGSTDRAPAAPTEGQATDATALPREPRVVDVQLQVPPVTATRPGFETVTRYTEQFYAGELEKLFERFSDEMKTQLPLDRLRELHAFVAERYGREVELIDQDTQTKDEYRGFVRWARFSDHEGVIQIEWILRRDDTIAGFFIRPAQPQPGG